MLCRVCRQDLEMKDFSDEVYERAVFRAEVHPCRACSLLSRIEQKATTREVLFGNSRRARMTPPKWDGLSETQKRECLQSNRTHCEGLVEEALLSRGVDYQFQFPVGPYFVDFHIKPGKLAIEIDGGYHITFEQKEKDANRTDHLRRLGWRVIRFTNQEVRGNVSGIVDRIIAARDGTGTKKNAKAKMAELMRHGALRTQRETPSGCVVVAKPTS